MKSKGASEGRAIISESSELPSFRRPKAHGGPGFSGPGGFCTGSGTCVEDGRQGRGWPPAFPAGSERAASWFGVNSLGVLSKNSKTAKNFWAGHKKRPGAEPGLNPEVASGPEIIPVHGPAVQNTRKSVWIVSIGFTD